jgi:hypothetical protein
MSRKRDTRADSFMAERSKIQASGILEVPRAFQPPHPCNTDIAAT